MFFLSPSISFPFADYARRRYKLDRTYGNQYDNESHIGENMQRGFYSTNQQRYILDYLESHSNEALSAERICSELSKDYSVGKATVYRTLDRLVEKGTVIKVPSFEGRQARYRYIGEDSNPKEGRMVCLECGRSIAIECNHLEKLVKHIDQEHSFLLDTRHTVLYGYCRDCKGGK